MCCHYDVLEIEPLRPSSPLTKCPVVNTNERSITAHFYGFWMDFSTLRSFAWLDEHDLRQAPNAKYVKLNKENENKKLRDAGKKQRNEQIRELVQFARKRDKRVMAYRQVREERRQLQAQKQRKIVSGKFDSSLSTCNITRRTINKTKIICWIYAK
ncbi:hypothetical protein QR680_000398 [Steinernema hermaphroditum]|uniref:Zuotin-like zuotin homology domain-containing protein n=1 Tax=Steinernema hermaphroditum TaxID=289476 RepID=A0AA39GUF8_9BILA|nr:hypothetical protein QR680_000398 [Steinernema hermaphroditum]